MPRSPRPGPQVRTPEWRQRQSEGLRRWNARRRQMAAVAPSELLELEKTGTVSPSLRPYAAQAIEEADQLAQALGGVENLSPQRLVLIQDATRVGLVMRAMLARFLQGDGDPELASRIGTLVGARRTSLTALGLDRVSKEPDLAGYIASKAAQDHPGAANGSAPAQGRHGCRSDRDPGQPIGHPRTGNGNRRE